MMSARNPRVARTTWAVIGGLVLVAGIIAIIVGAVTSRGPDATVTPPASSDPTPQPNPTASAPTTAPPGNVVDASVAERGWVPEPITTDAETYVQAVLAAASTFDTTRSSRDEWLAYLDTWFTPDTRYESEADRAETMKASQLELRQGVVPPQEVWDSLAGQDGRVEADVSGDIALAEVPEDASAQMRIATGDVELTFTQTDGTGAESSYTEDARVSVQVLCGADSVPSPNTSQRAGDCKLVRFFTEPLES
ncbi:hypothetical protein [Microbacterium invictum]|uniref:Uncharacterized protein n=1 Tax=Microbacterium invictum TaxID=515415 RepID=A0AA40SR05_9MICO|nr:hypothetical protein [Microbacterium invictum]MBB4140788.1 hypothetical protein [Microbacterium invictum]